MAPEVAVNRLINILMAGIFLLAGFRLAASQEPSPPPTEAKAHGFLAAARAYAKKGDWERAHKFVESALETAPEDLKIGKDTTEVLEQIRTGEQAILETRQRALLKEARRLAASGESEKAREMIANKLEAFNPPLLAEAERELAAIHRGWLRARWASFLRAGWLIDAVLAILLVVGILLFRRYKGHRHRSEWLINNIDDPTGLGIGLLSSERLCRWSEESTGASAGLLRLDGLRVQSVPRLSQDRPEVALPATLAELPSVGQVNLGAVARALEAIRRWAQGFRPTISIAVYALDQQVVVRLTRKPLAGKVYTVSAQGAKSFEGSAQAVDSASFKMYYILANQAPIREAEAADQLRSGLDHLRRHLVQRDSSELQSAYDIFRAVRSESPDLEEAHFYEGVALDLMERHEEAESIFRFLAEHGQGEVRERALYNEAVSQFRKYKPEELERAIATLDVLIGPEILGDIQGTQPRIERLVGSPIRAMALAARANAIAHKPIFWQDLLFGNRIREPEDDLLTRKLRAQGVVFEWLEEVRRISEILLDLSEKSLLNARTGWDPMAWRQLQWAAHNAQGNGSLNAGMNFLAKPHLPGNNEPQRQVSLFKRAYNEFRMCESLLPPGVETLTNLATTLLNLSRMSESRSYAEAAIKTNPDYEYAYYRLAQAWEKENQPEKTLETLRSFQRRRSPGISGFKTLFDKYYIDLISS